MWRPMYAIVVPLARAGVRTSKVPMLGVMLPRDTRSFTSTPRVRFSSAFTETCVHTWCHADPFMIPAGMHFHWPNRSRRGDSTPNLPLTRLLLHIDHGLLPATLTDRFGGYSGASGREFVSQVVSRRHRRCDLRIDPIGLHGTARAAPRTVSGGRGGCTRLLTPA